VAKVIQSDASTKHPIQPLYGLGFFFSLDLRQVVWERIAILSDTIYEIFAPIEAVAMTQEEWDQGDLFVTDFARNGEVLFAA
jgi:hypothetical protein